MHHSLDFHPTPGLASPHLQMFLANFGPTGEEPPSEVLLIKLADGDQLSCEVSTPKQWKHDQPTIILLHGAGGSHLSPYMIRLSRKLYHSHFRVVRINLRGAGSGEGLSKRPYNFGTSQDVWTVIKELKKTTPHSPLRMIGFSMGGSMLIKMAGELGEKAHGEIENITAVCPVLDLDQTVRHFSYKKNWVYHQYFLKKFVTQGKQWIPDKVLKTIKEFDDTVTAPLWGYKNAQDYYEQCSSYKYISDVKIPCDMILAADDPFIDHQIIKKVKLPSQTKAWVTSHGGHMGFIGSTRSIQGPFWLDTLLVKWQKREK